MYRVAVVSPSPGPGWRQEQTHVSPSWIAIQRRGVRVKLREDALGGRVIGRVARNLADGLASEDLELDQAVEEGARLDVSGQGFRHGRQAGGSPASISALEMGIARSLIPRSTQTKQALYTSS